jgi:hypothetical protein
MRGERGRKREWKKYGAKRIKQREEATVDMTERGHSRDLAEMGVLPTERRTVYTPASPV